MQVCHSQEMLTKIRESGLWRWTEATNNNTTTTVAKSEQVCSLSFFLFLFDSLLSLFFSFLLFLLFCSFLHCSVHCWLSVSFCLCSFFLSVFPFFLLCFFLSFCTYLYRAFAEEVTEDNTFSIFSPNNDREEWEMAKTVEEKIVRDIKNKHKRETPKM